MESITLIYKIM